MGITALFWASYLDNIWVHCKALGQFWSAPGIVLVDLRLTALGPTLGCDSMPKFSQSQFAIWATTDIVEIENRLKIYSNRIRDQV